MAQNNNKKLLNQKTWQMLKQMPASNSNATFVIADPMCKANIAMYVTSTSVQYLYHHDEDAFVQIPSGALSGGGGGGCGAYSRWSNTLTANGGSTTTATTATLINGICIGETIRFLTGSNAGEERIVTGAIINPSGTQTLQFAALPSAVVSTDTFTLSTGLFFVLMGGTLAASSFKSYDVVTGTWTPLSITGLPPNWVTDGRLVSENSYQNQYVTSTSSGSNTTTTLNDTTRSWLTNNFNSYQVRIIAGTGKGQIRNIVSNTSNQLTVQTAWTTTPNATSQYVIEANDDYLYLLGNGAVTLYRYQESTNTWSTLTPTTARTGAPSTGLTAEWVGKTGDTNWAIESNLQDGRYIISFRGGGSSVADRYDIALNTWVALPTSNAETFTTGTSSCWNGRYIYLKKDAINRFFKFSVRGLYMEPLTSNPYTDGAGIVGNRLWIKDYDDTNTIEWLYAPRQSGTELFRMLLI